MQKNVQATLRLAETNNSQLTRPAVFFGGECELISRTAAGNRAYVLIKLKEVIISWPIRTSTIP